MAGYAFVAGVANGDVSHGAKHEGREQVEAILRQAVKPPPKGSVAYDTATQKQVLSVGGKAIHASTRVEERYSASADGAVIAVVAFSSALPSPDQAEIGADGKVHASMGEVWVKRGDHPAMRLSSNQIHAQHPSVSPDGRYVAFTGASRLHNGAVGAESVFLVNLEKAPKQDGMMAIGHATYSDGVARVIKWEDSHTLLIYISEDPDGSKARIERIAVPPA